MDQHLKKPHYKKLRCAAPPTTLQKLNNLKSPSLPVDRMTSSDFQRDINAHIEVAAQLLKDEVRIRNFQAAILHNRHLFQGRTVLDIGCGIGILSLFAAKAGAAQVYAVDYSNVIDYTRSIVAANGYAEIIHVIKGRIEDIQLPIAEVDIIVCDWMGYSLLFQSTCDAVIFARDKWLKKDSGLIFPDVAKLFVSAVEDDKHKNERVEWWRDVYGFNMKCLRDFALSEPSFQSVQPHQILSTHYEIKSLNLYTAKKEDLKFRSKYMLEMKRCGRMDGVVTYFHVHFSKSHTRMGFSTDPWSPNTHWMQSVFYFDTAISVNAGQLYYGGIEMFSTEAECDLNNMEVGLEMFSGDPMSSQIVIEMRWKLKPHAEAVSSLNVSVPATSSSTKNKKSVEKLNVEMNILPTCSSSKNKSSAKSPHHLKKTSPKEIVPYITLGEREYPCVVEKRKTKYSKKG